MIHHSNYQKRAPKGHPVGGQWMDEDRFISAARDAAGVLSEEELAKRKRRQERRRARRAAKKAASERPAELLIREQEEALRDLPRERALVFDPDTGKLLWSADGDKSSVSFTGSEVLLMKDKILSHNHPTSRLPHSEADFYFAASSNVREMRVVAGNLTYVVRRKGYWSFDLRDKTSLRLNWKSVQKSTLLEALKMSGTTQRTTRGLRLTLEGVKIQQDLVMKDLAELYDFEYERIPPL